ncbi:ABC transporter permease [Actinoalloteichus sp. AHMU CJ021]|uniref:ABC-2 type transport system permease protein n=1 Tax=Actinoalloteichus caeruleus DSM 43889 TaxID=1120930 RepID=A0ABT1JN88_ACTCY|nr:MULTISPECIES: ABC transporter permease [Actinoalloteichus]AUS79322.1 ABC transporter permease [Actinoalloteichus sp. AHMU CJ021]MCP2333601.1 ABC-2 type transport system permease protein [Actinoalloteichus caeruleus DSM 43889]
MRMLLLHARYQLLETARIPIAMVGNLVFPALIMLFFVVPQSQVGGDPVAATAAAGQLSLFAVINVCLYTFGAGIAEDRAQPWDAYVRTLPVGAGPRFGGRLLTGLFFCLLGLIPVIVVAALFTSAQASPAQILAGVAVVLGCGVPFLLMGLAVGYHFSVKASLVVVQLLVFPMAFVGGLFMPPEIFPSWLDTASHAVPTRAGRDLVVNALTGGPVDGTALLVLLGWTAVLAVLAVVAFRRDEGRRFR